MIGTKGHGGGVRAGSGPKKKPANFPCRVCGSTDRYKSRECKTCAKRRNQARHNLLQNTSEKYRDKNKARRKKNYPRKKQINRAKQLLKLYGLTIEQYEAMLASQSGACFICKKPQSDLQYALAVDHCHKTGRVRALLCPTCNNAVAMFENYGDAVRDYLSQMEIFK